MEGHCALARSEGLAAASVALFASGALSADRRAPLRSDAEALARITPARLAQAFQAGPANPLEGLEGRAALLGCLGRTMGAQPQWFGSPPRLGNLLDAWRARAGEGQLAAGAILESLLAALGPIWPGRIVQDGVALGDCWRHPAARGGLVPFHKLSQWLAYSLFEPFEWAGMTVTDRDALTALPEYRNGGLLLDTGVLRLVDDAVAETTWDVGSELVVEWRALTVSLLDDLAEDVRAVLERPNLPLASILEGGTWAAGRELAARLRNGEPPLRVSSDGTVF